MAAEKGAPYVISADVNLLMQAWSKETGYVVPQPSFFNLLSEERKRALEEIFEAPVEVVSECELTSINALCLRSEYPLVSLDRIYLDPCLPNLEGFIDMTRVVDEDFKDIPDEIIYSRQGYLPIEEQLAVFVREKEEPVTIIDDVLFSGKGLVSLAKMLAEINRPVRQAIFGIAIGEGLERAKDAGIEVECVHEYPDVIDEICERDFLAGVPLSGRTLICREGGYWGAPYFKPFGNPERWASIPEKHSDIFSKLCIAQSVRLWREIEDLSGEKISTYKTPRRIKNLRHNDSIVEALQEHYNHH